MELPPFEVGATKLTVALPTPVTVAVTWVGVSGASMTCPILLPYASVNQRLPSGPLVMRMGKLSEVGTVYSEMA